MSHYRISRSGLLLPFAPHIIKRRFIEGEVGARMSMEGLYRLQVRRADGSLKRDTGWFRNIITDGGLNRLGTGAAGGTCVIGTGTATPAATDSALQNLSASTTNINQYQMSNSGAPDYAHFWTRTFRFALGALNGNYTEVGVGWATSSLFSRALILDGGGNPTTITVLADEQLDVIYQLRTYSPTTDWGGTYTIGGVSTDVVGRLSQAGGTFGGTGGPLSGSLDATVISGFGKSAYTGDIGVITGLPSGTNNSVVTAASATYSNNSLVRDTTVTGGLNEWNLSGGIRSVHLPGSTAVAHSYQYQFTPKIAKDNTKTLALTFRIGWGRRP